MFHKGIVFLGCAFGQWLKPVGIMCCAHLHSPLFHTVGHGIGYSVHEGPYITQQNFRRLERGMCFSIEPGVYLPGKWGMRIENIVCINENGETEVLNKADRSLRVLDWYKK